MSNPHADSLRQRVLNYAFEVGSWTLLSSYSSLALKRNRRQAHYLPAV
jgi:hypothetical protein